MKLAHLCLIVFCTAALVMAAGMPAQADVVLSEVSWNNELDPVSFHLVFYNTDLQQPSELTTGSVYAQEFGVFLPDQNLVAEFDIPPIPPDSFFDVFFDVPRGELPPSAAEILPGGGPLGPGVLTLASVLCPPDDHWDGNVDVIWMGPLGPAQVLAHYGTLYVGPGVSDSYIHVVTGCAGPATWTITGLCTGFTATLVNEDFTPAPNPVPAGWTGHIAVSALATTPVGSTCCFQVNFNCGGVVGTVNLCVEVCDWTTPVTPTTWGQIKSLYR